MSRFRIGEVRLFPYLITLAFFPSVESIPSSPTPRCATTWLLPSVARNAPGPMPRGAQGLQREKHEHADAHGALTDASRRRRGWQNGGGDE
ncbi:hypothetical protein P171DRAFT_92430 [Karstenula rhodostoma CBS 690.94]|uniref:Secreted protein n=1 Tax=Karstenula rhodostoma CBS 690.94 TaxID=1392251 RepID=A0A9P4PDU8_9PLEO|nr:hypothetical protein P171DRAFT_92430 [Karstenula rhodostoma CBS 690.94]